MISLPDADMQSNFLPNIEHCLQSEVRLLELGIRDYRATAGR
jgi:hypothetical protein